MLRLQAQRQGEEGRRCSPAPQDPLLWLGDAWSNPWPGAGRGDALSCRTGRRSRRSAAERHFPYLQLDSLRLGTCFFSSMLRTLMLLCRPMHPQYAHHATQFWAYPHVARARLIVQALWDRVDGTPSLASSALGHRSHMGYRLPSPNGDTHATA